jgi:hypothetical protein
LDFGSQVRNEAGVNFRKGNDTFDANAVLASGLEDAAHEDTGNAIKVTIGKVVEHDCRIFAA